MFFQQPPPNVVWIVPQQKRPPGIGDTLHSLFSLMLSSIGLVGALVLTAVVAGGVMAWVLVRRNRRHPPELDRLPPVTPVVAIGRDKT